MSDQERAPAGEEAAASAGPDGREEPASASTGEAPAHSPTDEAPLPSKQIPNSDAGVNVDAGITQTAGQGSPNVNVQQTVNVPPPPSVNVNVQTGAPVIMVADSGETNIVVRAAWFLFIGWWLSFLAVTLAVLLQLTIIGIPAAIWLINRIPQIVTLKSSRKLQIAASEAGITMVARDDRPQHRWYVRTLWYIVVGWWATALWLYTAWLASVTILLLPLGFWMFGQTGKVQTLRR